MEFSCEQNFTQVPPVFFLILDLVRNTEVSAWDARARTLGQPTHLVATHPTVKYQDFRKLFPSSSKGTVLMKFKRLKIVFVIDSLTSNSQYFERCI